MTNTIEVGVIFDITCTRACLKTEDGEFVLSTMHIDGNRDDPDAITLTPVGKTRDARKARAWVVMGIAP